MKSVLTLSLLFLCLPGVHAQAPSTNLPMQNPTSPSGPVPISEEPHHRLVLQNDFTHVYNVMVPGLDATLLHQHDFPYLYVTLGPADIMNSIVGKPELHQVLQDGEVHYTPGHFAHSVRTDSGIPFRNITIELARPQGTLRNLCKDLVAKDPLNCPETPSAAVSNKRKNTTAEPAGDREDVPYFETDEIRVDLHRVSSGNDYVDADAKLDALLVGLTNSNLDANLGGEHFQFLHGGDVIWMPAGQHRRIVDFLGTHSGFLLITFKDGTKAESTR